MPNPGQEGRLGSVCFYDQLSMNGTIAGEYSNPALSAIDLVKGS